MTPLSFRKLELTELLPVWWGNQGAPRFKSQCAASSRNEHLLDVRKILFLFKNLMKSIRTGLFWIVTAPTILATVTSMNWYVKLFVEPVRTNIIADTSSIYQLVGKVRGEGSRTEPLL